MKRRKLNTNKVMGILFFFLLLTLGTCFFLKSDFFYLKEVVINNNKYLSKNEVENLILTVEAALSKNGKQIDKAMKSNIKNELASFKKLTKKVDFETCDQAKFDEIKSAKINLESVAASLLSMQ